MLTASASLLLGLLLMPLALAGSAADAPAGPSLQQRIDVYEREARLLNRQVSLGLLTGYTPTRWRLTEAPPIRPRGQPLLVHVWSVHCKPCIREMPALANVLHDLSQERAVRVLLLSEDAPADLRAYVDEHGRDLPAVEHYILTRDSPLRASLQETSQPVTLLLDPQLVVRQAFVGPVVDRRNELFSAVGRLCRSLGTVCRRPLSP
ncbi:MAG: TlpA disulfide reductase family protein [Polyangia bacterium]